MGFAPVAAMLVIVGTLASCTAKDDPDPHTDSDPDPDTDSDTDTDTHTEPLAVSCAATGNELRFECTVHVDPPQAVELEFARADGLSAARTVASDDALPEHVLPLYFMAPTQDYDVTVRAPESELVATTSVTTGAVPPEFESSLVIDEGAATFPMIGVNLPCIAPGTPDGLWEDAMAVVYDTTTGDLLWYENMDPGGSFGPNDMLRFTDEHTVLGESRGDVIEVDLMGRDLVRLEGLAAAMGATNGGLFADFHHDIAKRDGVYYVTYEQTYYGDPGGDYDDVLDNLILFDATGTEIARWYAEEHLTIPVGWADNFTLINALDVDPAGDIIISVKGQDTVIKVVGDWTRPDFGETIWIWDGGGAGQVGNTITADWSAVGDPSTFSNEHSTFVRPDGLLQLLDNNEGRGLVLDIDEVAQTGTVLAEYDTGYPRCGPQGTSRSTLAGNPLVGCSGGRDGIDVFNYVTEYDHASSALQWRAHPVCPDGDYFNATRWYPLEGW